MRHGRTISYALTVTATLAAIVIFARCEPPPEPDGPRVPGAIVEFEGVSIMPEDVERWTPYLATWDPKSGQKARRRVALEKEVLPLALSRSAFPGQRAEQLERAREVRSVVGNTIELEAFAEAREFEQATKPYSRSSLPLAVAEFAFLEEHVGAVSDPIEVERGYVLVGVKDLQRGLATAYDLVHLVIAPFYTHPSNEYDAWLEDARTRAKATLSYVHPDYVDLLPIWLQD